MVRQCFILFGCLALGELIVRTTGATLPASIIGMLILTLLLKLKVVKLEWVRGLTDFLIRTVGLIHHGCFQNLMRGAQPETMDI